MAIENGAAPTTHAPLFALQGLSKSFDGFAALDDVSMQLYAGEVHCLLGENGAGKSTLCSILSGAYRATQGAMRLEGTAFAPRSPKEAARLGVAMVHQHYSVVQTLSALDNLLLGSAWLSLRRKARRHEVMALLERHGFAIPLDAPASTLSIGQLQQLEITKCLLHRPRLLILDEPTAVLAPEAVARLVALVRQMAASGLAVLLVTHKLAEIEQAADRISVLRRGRLVDEGNLETRGVMSFVRTMIGTDAAEAAHAPARPAESASAAAKQDVLMLDGVTVLGSRQQKTLDNLTLLVRRTEVVGIAGVEGNGQTVLAGVLTGANRVYMGRVFTEGHEITNTDTARVRRKGVAIIPEDRHRDACILDLPLAHNLFLDTLDNFSRHGQLDLKALGEAARLRMRAFDIRATSPFIEFRRLSGGNQQKAVVARELDRPDIKAVVAVHPTRGLDHGAAGFMYARLRHAAEAGAAVLVVSSELAELMAHCHRIVVLFKGRIAGELPAREFSRDRLGRMMAGMAA